MMMMITGWWYFGSNHGYLNEFGGFPSFSPLDAFVGRRMTANNQHANPATLSTSIGKTTMAVISLIWLEDLKNLKVRNVITNSRNENPTICCNCSMETEKKAESIYESIELVSCMVPEYRAFPGLPDS
jgi:hypothetical protein